jgi:endonuclease III
MGLLTGRTPEVSRLSLERVVEALQKTYGRPKPPRWTDPWRMILAENVAYLATDPRREEAFKVLESRVGLEPERIRVAGDEDLMAATSLGIVPANAAHKLRKCAQIALEEFAGDLSGLLKLPLTKAKAAFKKFPSIGEPGAEKILLFSRAYPVFALESNGLRVLIRLGIGEEKPNYAATYRAVQADVADELKPEFTWLIAGHQLLRQHGQELCRRNRPLCPKCPLKDDCAFACAAREA